MNTLYYDQHADLAILHGMTVGIIGYGSQGHAHALNLRDAGMRVVIGNRQDRFAERAVADGFEVTGFDAVARQADVLLLLVPDQAQAEIYETHLKHQVREGCLLIFAHGYALRYKTVVPETHLDVALLAPRMPGHYVRSYFLKGGGVPAFADVIHDATGQAWARVLAVAKAMGFTRAGVLRVDYAVEAELDLFIEQFVVASLVERIHAAFHVLVHECHYPAMPVLMELYASGELAEVLKLAAQKGIGKVFEETASPTCQFGIASHVMHDAEPALKERARRIIQEIRDGSFAKRLEYEGQTGYRMVKQLWKTVNEPRLVEAQQQINDAFQWRAS